MSTTVFRLKNRNQRQFVQLDKASIWDQNLSLKAVGLWTRLMSRPDDWNFHVSELAKANGVSEKNIYKILKELISAGYAKRERIIDPQTKKIVRWEFEVFEVSQKSTVVDEKNHLPQNDQVESHLVDSGHITNIDSTDKEKTDIDIVDENPSTSSLPIKTELKKEKKALPIDAWDVAQKLWETIQKHFPKHKPPKMEDWAKDIDLMNRIDHRDWDDIRRAIDFAFEDAFWVKVIQSADGLRRNFDKLFAQMTPVDNSGARMQKNRSMAYEAKSAIKANVEKWKNFYIGDNKVVRLDTNESIDINLESKIFEAKMLQIFKLTKD